MYKPAYLLHMPEGHLQENHQQTLIPKWTTTKMIKNWKESLNLFKMLFCFFFLKQLNQRDLVACKTFLKSSEAIQTHAEDFTIMINCGFQT